MIFLYHNQYYVSLHCNIFTVTMGESIRGEQVPRSIFCLHFSNHGTKRCNHEPMIPCISYTQSIDNSHVIFYAKFHRN